MQNDTGPLGMLVLLFVVFMVYFMPCLNAYHRRHPNFNSIFLLNLLLGWTLIGWVIAIVWSASSIPPVEPIRVRPETEPSEDKYQKIERLGGLKDKGLLTESEYEAEKAKILQS
ncbi:MULTISPECIES: superinfection immunity protein [Pseudomonas]|uniref:Superinfection immunity protein n=1 Tax=Pseudomonas aphyarum TaxID=2942629 RepID=A0ABT5PMX7_9PSED|nr:MULTISPECIES: superinfection immunity protein [Pseudomonas]MBS4088738.1 superinfection immunity protein [Pseudomonas rustica]MDD0971606.1 superinfection immunity protein [Pseudomonas aphyarum]MDD1125242.1 superinfection immunity protein [Pseudomonas aphyarum]